MDEFHFFSDSDRGWAWQVPLLALPNVQFLLMSATLGDVDQIAGLLERQTGKDVSRIIDAPRPVPLSYEYALTSLEGTVGRVRSTSSTSHRTRRFRARRRWRATAWRRRNSARR